MAFWILAPIMVVAALGILFVRKAVHAALLLAVVMMSLAVLYAVLDAPFLFAVQIIVYTGAILMLFLFVLMLVGVDAADSVVETIRGQRLMATVLGLVLGLVLVTAFSQLALGTAVGLDEANAGGNIQQLANILFSRYVFAFEATSALLITAAIGAMVLAHRERLTPSPPRPRWPRSGCATSPSPASTSARCRPRASTPGTTRSTPRRCCPTAPRPRRRSPACWPPAGRCARRRRTPTTSTRYAASSVPGAATPSARTRTMPEQSRQGGVPGQHRGGRLTPMTNEYIVLSAILFTIGCVGVLTRRNAIVVFMCVELMLNACNLALVTFAKQHGNLDGQIAAFFVMVVAAAEVVIGLAIIMTIFRTRRSASVDDASLLKY